MAKQRKITRDPRTGELYARIMRNGVSKRFKRGKDQRKARSKLIQIENDIAAGKIRFDNIEKAPQPTRPANDNPDIGVSDLIRPPTCLFPPLIVQLPKEEDSRIMPSKARGNQQLGRRKRSKWAGFTPLPEVYSA